jgi:phytoene dehydrogenase-like protein
MVEALCRARCGQKVAVVEGRDRVGGAWATIDLPGMPDVPAHCHLLTLHDEAYDLMREDLGWDMRVRRPQPRVVVGGWDLYVYSPLYYLTKLVRLTYRRLRPSARVGFWASTEAATNPVATKAQYLRAAFRRAVRRRVAYPAGGAREVSARLEAELQKAGVTIRVSHTIRQLRVATDTECVHAVGDGHEWTAREVVVSNGSRLDRILVDGDEILVPTAPVSSCTFTWSWTTGGDGACPMFTGSRPRPRRRPRPC